MDTPDYGYLNAVQYARFHEVGWHRIKSWGDYQIIHLACGRIVNLWEGDGAAQVVGKPPDGLCEACRATETVQAVMEGMA